ncbi:GtrA family protein [Bacillus lacus]|uniref:GtrA family protein n=1 Tax=Metabacillus lacus TaxID=1983721 RepID=A0A7X2J1M2_9BACI|nr:GtrA family protein [Metabacillus lacus]MRX73720.1 GtrA family protein [Metabacillus lacus]
MLKSSFSRFILVGLINTALGLSTMFILLHGAGLSYWVATLGGNAAGACSSFVLNRSFTFQSKRSVHQTLLRFLIVICICYFFAYFVGFQSASWAIHQIAELPLGYVEDIAILLGSGLYTILTYIGQRRFVFLK